ncbi:MAG: TraR/DksA C4-type zinc finger protein [Psychromonas sp.]
MSDIVDKANKHSEAALQRQINNQRHPPTARAHIVDGKHCCMDCENIIPLERSALYPDAPRCVPCQTNFEEGRKHFA